MNGYIVPKIDLDITQHNLELVLFI